MRSVGSTSTRSALAIWGNALFAASRVICGQDTSTGSELAIWGGASVAASRAMDWQERCEIRHANTFKNYKLLGVQCRQWCHSLHLRPSDVFYCTMHPEPFLMLRLFIFSTSHSCVDAEQEHLDGCKPFRRHRDMG